MSVRSYNRSERISPCTLRCFAGSRRCRSHAGRAQATENPQQVYIPAQEGESQCSNELHELGPVKAVKLPAQIKILHDSWEVYYQSDDIIGPIWPQLQQDRVLHPYVYCDGKVRREGRIVVPGKF